jgi:hypothetical protein
MGATLSIEVGNEAGILAIVVGVLREAKELLSAAEIGRAMLDAKGVTDPDKEVFRKFINGAQASLANHNGNGHRDRAPSGQVVAGG